MEQIQSPPVGRQAETEPATAHSQNPDLTIPPFLDRRTNPGSDRGVVSQRNRIVLRSPARSAQRYRAQGIARHGRGGGMSASTHQRQLIGRCVRMDTPCRRCGSNAAIIKPGTGPHLGALHCQSCGVHRQWISRESFVAIGKVVAAVVAQLGIEPAEITFRNPPKKEGCETSPADAHDLRRAGDDSLDRPIRATATTGRVRFFPRKNKQTAQPNEPVPFDDPIPGF
jgi:hypothetical protein